MGHSLERKPKVRRSRWLSSGTIASLMTTDVPRICSHQQVDDHRKRENHTYKTHNKQQKGKLEPKVILSWSQAYFHSQQHIHHPSMLWKFHQYTTTRLDSTHPDIYNLVGFSGCLHLWWIPLLTPERCVTSVTMNQSPTHKVSP